MLLLPFLCGKCGGTKGAFSDICMRESGSFVLFLAAGGLPFFGVFTLSSTPVKVKRGGGGLVSAFPEASATVFPYFFGPKITGKYQCVL